VHPRRVFLGLAAVFVVSLLAPWSASAYPSYADQQDGSGLSRFRLHGYGEVHYNNPRTGTMDQNATSEADYHRFVLGWTYEFTPDLRLDAEIDYEHAADELELEYAHLDYDLGATTTFRVGSILMPVGPLNEFHEPPTFYSVERPYVQNAVIPTTWQENGLGLVGRASGGSLGYRAFVVAGLDASMFSAASGLRGGRSKGIKSKAEDLAIVGRLEYATTAGVSFAASGYYGGADQMTVDSVDVKVGLGVADLRYKRHGFDVRALYARVEVDGAEEASALASAAAGSPVVVGEAMQGWYTEVAYDLLRRDRKPDSRRSLWIFSRYERFNTHEEMPAGFAADPAADRTVVSGGVAFLPIESVSFKADVEHWKDETTGPNSQLNRVNVGAAFMF
jgi:hypothetical protein